MCNFFIKKKGRKCLRSPKLEYCYKHKQTHQEVINNEEKEDCAVCYTECSEKTICGHFVHESCIITWGQNKCPLCRRENIIERTLISESQERVFPQNQYTYSVLETVFTMHIENPFSTNEELNLILTFLLDN